MNRSVVLRRLCWKEFRQLLPLVVMLAAIGLVFQILLLISKPQHTSLTQNLFFSGLPGLFAAGVGALLVGQERDSGTLFWMASLPIRKQDIIRVKFLAGIVGLVSVWTFSFALFLVSNGFTSLKTELDIASGILYSIFLLFVSFATAWTFRSTFVGLLVLVSVAMSYTITGNLLTQVTEAKSSDFFTTDFSKTIVLVAISALALWLGWIAALRALGPIAPVRFTQRAISGVSFFDRSIVDRRTIQTPWSALIWQFAAQNRAMLAGLTLLFLLPLCIGSCAIILNRPGSSSDWIEVFTRFGFIISFVSISWLGVVTFQGDNLNQRIRFLSDRGILPRTIWLTRQTVPMGMLIVGTVALAVAVSTVY